MIKALKELFNNGIPTEGLYKTHYNVYDNIHEVYTMSNWNVRSYLSAYNACKKANWKASQINEIGTDIDGNPFVRMRFEWQRGTKTIIEITIPGRASWVSSTTTGYPSPWYTHR